MFEQVQALPASLRHVTGLTSLYLGARRDKKITSQFCDRLAIPASLSVLTGLENLALDAHGLVHLEHLSGLPALTSLYLRCSDMSPLHLFATRGLSRLARLEKVLIERSRMPHRGHMHVCSPALQIGPLHRHDRHEDTQRAA